VGHSYGGLFALFGLFEAPDLFDTLIIGSPTLSYGNRFTFQQEETFAKEHKKLPAKVYLFVGELEESLNDHTVTDTLRLAAILQGRQYEGFSLVKHVFPDQNHCEVAAPGFQAGLKFALKK
jgi:predicted alpha/beta superfamily hydrolase